MNTKQGKRKLLLNRETIAHLDPSTMDNVHGGVTPVSAVVSLVSVATAAICVPIVAIFGTFDGPKGEAVGPQHAPLPVTAPTVRGGNGKIAGR
jgi:hypothetical protein